MASKSDLTDDIEQAIRTRRLLAMANRMDALREGRLGDALHWEREDLRLWGKYRVGAPPLSEPDD